MYTGKSSKNPNMPLIWGALMGIGLIVFGIYLYFDLAAWENSNEEMRLNSLLWFLYDIGGKLTVAGIFALIGAIVFGGGFKKTQELRKLKNGSHKS